MKIYIIAGEVSGDQIAARLLKALKTTGQEVELRGIGGSLMAAEGLTSSIDMKEFAVNGLVEVIRHIPRLQKRMAQIVEEVLAYQPDLLLTVDSPGLALRIHKKIDQAFEGKDKPFKQVHIVAPTVWAWKPWRAKKMADYLDHLLVNLPFEPPYFTVHGLKTDYVGHPVTELVPMAQAEEFLAGTTPGKRYVVLAPGSRRSEVSKLLPTFMEAAKTLIDQDPELEIIVPTVETVEAQVRDMLTEADLPHHLVLGQEARWQAFAAADLAIAASGTIALELGMLSVPTVVSYKTNGLTAAIAKRLVKVKYASLINLLCDKPVQPELIQENCTTERILEHAQAFLNDAEALAIYKAETAEIAASLEASDGFESPSAMAAHKLIELVQSESA